VWEVLASEFTRHESLQLFPLGLPQTVYCTNLHTVQELQAKIKALTKAITGDMGVTQMTTVWFIYSESTISKDLILNMHSHKGHLYINSM